MNVTISNNARGTITAHSHDCRDLKREYAEVRWTITAETRRDVVLSVYPPDEFNYDPDTQLDYYAEDINFKPCVKQLG